MFGGDAEGLGAGEVGGIPSMLDWAGSQHVRDISFAVDILVSSVLEVIVYFFKVSRDGWYQCLGVSGSAPWG